MTTRNDKARTARGFLFGEPRKPNELVLPTAAEWPIAVPVWAMTPRIYGPILEADWLDFANPEAPERMHLQRGQQETARALCFCSHDREATIAVWLLAHMRTAEGRVHLPRPRWWTELESWLWSFLRNRGPGIGRPDWHSASVNVVPDIGHGYAFALRQPWELTPGEFIGLARLHYVAVHMAVLPAVWMVPSSYCALDDHHLSFAHNADPPELEAAPKGETVH